MRLSKFRIQARTETERQAREKFEAVWADACRIYKLDDSKKPSFGFFDHKAAKSGFISYGHNYIAINAPLLEQEKENLINRTISHEVAHHVSFFVFGKSGHCQTWRNIWSRLGGTNISRCHSFNVKGIAKERTVLYHLIDIRTSRVVKNYYRKPKLNLGIQNNMFLKNDKSALGYIALIKSNANK